MAKPHWKPKNVTLTGNSALRAKQFLGSEYTAPVAPIDWSQNEGLNASAAALEKMIANGWQGYANGYGSKRKRAPRKVTAAEVKAWMAANYEAAAELMAELAPEKPALKLAA